ncbi:1190_t:CDS:2 [Funneliformis caledonium]|uniref:1190_t:CDS:1 n=2 Tax=Funneliformis TaxID=1117308 RepID=A0A9N8ZTN3_9GLOM|nr:1190_t:CDS:2 [Funneliformis caledonium]CAG8608827.1 5628_t:CDS:2 [Funneliformis mosseae]
MPKQEKRQQHSQITCLNDIAIKNEIITEHFGFLPISFEEVEQGTHQVETLLENLVDKYFEQFEIYALHKIFTIRENVTVGVNFDVDESMNEGVDKEIELLRKKIMAAKAFNLKLKKQLAIDEARIEKLKRLENKISFLRTEAKAHNVSPLPDTLRFISDQLLAITKVYNNLNESVKDEKLKQYENTIDEREKFISMMVLRHGKSL